MLGNLPPHHGSEQSLAPLCEPACAKQMDAVIVRMDVAEDMQDVSARP